jgi:hypothetical protein
VLDGGVYGPGIFFDEIFDAVSARTPYPLFTLGTRSGATGAAQGLRSRDGEAPTSGDALLVRLDGHE